MSVSTILNLIKNIIHLWHTSFLFLHFQLVHIPRSSSFGMFEGYTLLKHFKQKEYTLQDSDIAYDYFYKLELLEDITNQRFIFLTILILTIRIIIIIIIITIIHFKFIEFLQLSTLTIIMELTEYLFVNFMILNITMTSCTNPELSILRIDEKRLIFIFILIVEKQLSELYVSYTKRYNHKYFDYLRYLHFGSRYCGQFLIFSRWDRRFQSLRLIYAT